MPIKAPHVPHALDIFEDAEDVFPQVPNSLPGRTSSVQQILSLLLIVFKGSYNLFKYTTPLRGTLGLPQGS